MVAFALDASGAVSALRSFDFSEPRLWGQTPRWGLDDQGEEGTQGQYHWYQIGEGGNLSVITNYATSAEAYDRFAEPTNPKPSYMQSGAANKGYLEACIETPLVRTFKELQDKTGKVEPIAVPVENDLFVDSLVRFEPRFASASEIPTVNVDGRAKFICWLSAPEGAGVTNLIVTAGRYLADGTVVRANYVATNAVVAGAWYRLTARAIRNAATAPEVSGASAFALYLDGVPVSCEPASYAIGEDAAEMRARFVGNRFFDACALFPSIQATEYNPSLRGLAVQGRAGLDEIGVVNEGDPFSRATDLLEAVVALETDKVTNVVCTIVSAGGETTFTTNTTGVASVLLTVRPGDTIQVAALAGEGYSLASALAVSGNDEAVLSHTAYAVTLKNVAEFESSERLVLRILTEHAYFRVGDHEFESLEKAIEAAAASGETLALGCDVTLDPTTENGQMRVLAAQEIVFDLRGHTIKGEHFQEEATIYDQGRLVIYDSVGGGAIVAPGTAIEVVSTNDALEANHAFASLTLGHERYAGVFTVKGRVRRAQGELVVKGGRYLTPFDVAADPFYLQEFVAADRFNVVGPEVVSEGGFDCTYWSVVYDGRFLVKFVSERGTVEPAYTNVIASDRLVRPVVTAPGYKATGWVDAATGTPWNFETDVVTGNLTLKAVVELETYAISYDPAMSSSASPKSYTVESVWEKLGTPTKANYSFAGWRDRTTGHTVDSVGQGATYVDDRESPVRGDLDLVAQWTANELLWQNTTVGNVESNGTYAGAWSFVIPVQSGLPAGTTVVIEEIAFGIVNPHLYPKTAPCLQVTPKAGAAARSAVRTTPYVAARGEYVLVSGDLLQNGRAKVAYRFADLRVKAGEANSVCFCAEDGSVPRAGFLRLKYNPADSDPVFGNCAENGGTPSSDAYLKYCPVYEVRGHLEEGGID